MKKLLSLTTILFASFLLSQLPGGVSGIDMWYKAGATIALSKDYGPNKYTVFQSNATLDLFNYNHSIRLQGNGNLNFPYSVEDMDVATIFTVYINSGNANSSLISSAWRTGGYIGNGNNEKQFFYSTNKLTKEDFSLKYPEDEEEIPNALINTLNWFDFNSKKINNEVGIGGESTVYIGKANTVPSMSAFNGLIPEFVIYRKALSKEERQRVESYLAIKYGITLTPDVGYYNSEYQTIWDRHNNSVFGNRIIAIGRDDASGLYQKQSTSSHTPNKEIIINAGVLKANNELNTSIINNNDFIFIGDNGLPADVELNEEGKINDWKMHPMERIWLVHPYFHEGEIPNVVATELRYNAAHLIDKIQEDYDEEFWDDITVWLFINRDGDETALADFSDFSQLDTYMVDATENDHVVYLEQFWDQDLSGFDQFTFFVGPKMLVDISLQEMECEDEFGNIDVQLTFGEPNFDFEILDETNQPIGSPVVDHTTRNITIEDIPIGLYTLKVTDGNGYEREVPFEVSPTLGMYINLEDQYVVPMDGSVILDASADVDPNLVVTYQWFRNGSVVTNTPNHLMPLEKPGTYRVVLTNENGCTVEDTTLVIDSEGARSNKEEEKEIIDDSLAKETIIIYPNPTQINHSFTVEINLLEKQDAQIQIYDFAGSLIHNEILKNSSKYQWNHRILQSGSYLITVITKNQKLTKKLIVK